MVTKKLIMKNLLLILFFTFLFVNNLFADANTDQWKNSSKTYKDLINEGFDVRAYDTLTINSEGGLTILLFITVLQKNKTVYECQEYQTLDQNMSTIDMSLVCKELTQPYERGLGT